jgi:hypothetical protein
MFRILLARFHLRDALLGRFCQRSGHAIAGPHMQ